MKILIITNSFPYDFSAEHTFLFEELKLLQQNKCRVTVAPLFIKGANDGVPKGVKVDESLANQLKDSSGVKRIIDSCFHPFVLFEFFRKPLTLLRPSNLKVALSYFGISLVVSKWLTSAQLSENFDVVYSFWFNQAALGVALHARYTNVEYLSFVRAHGGDLYEHRHSSSYIPFRGFELTHLDLVAPDSKAGTEYLQHRFPDKKDKFTEVLMGVKKVGFACNMTSGAEISLVSCSYLVDVKRVHLIAEAISMLVALNPNLRVRWNHFGGGEREAYVKGLAESLLEGRANWHFHGNCSINYIYKWYSENEVDLFINVSSSEGTPVSIMEALSMSIPVIATSVGGNKEAVDPSCGVLLNENPQIKEIADVIATVTQDKGRLRQLKKGAYKRWNSRYNLEKNANMLLGLWKCSRDKTNSLKSG